MYKKVKNLWDDHHTIRKAIKYFVYGGILTAGAYLTEAYQADPNSMIYLGVISLIVNYAKHNMDVLGIGGTKKKKKK